MRVAEALIRDMEKDELQHVLKIEHASFPTPWTEGMFRQQLMCGDIALNLVSTVDGAVVGYAVSWLAYDEIHLLSIAVIPSERRCGYASGLLDEVMRRGAARGADIVLLEVRAGNDAARRFYQKHGFKMIGTRRRYYVDTGEDAIVMERTIDA